MKKKHNFYLNYLSTDFNKKDNSFFIKKLNQHKEQVINKAVNDKNYLLQLKKLIFYFA